MKITQYWNLIPKKMHVIADDVQVTFNHIKTHWPQCIGWVIDASEWMFFFFLLKTLGFHALWRVTHKLYMSSKWACQQLIRVQYFEIWMAV